MMVCDRHNSDSSPGFFLFFFSFFSEIVHYFQHLKGATKSYKSMIDLTPAVTHTEKLASVARVSRPLSIPIWHQDFGYK